MNLSPTDMEIIQAINWHSVASHANNIIGVSRADAARTAAINSLMWTRATQELNDAGFTSPPASAAFARVENGEIVYYTRDEALEKMREETSG